MKQRSLRSAIILSVCFVLWTLIATFVGTEAIGPLGSVVGLAGLNGRFHELTGVHMALYELTDVLGSIPFAVCIGFGLVGLCQLIRRKKLLAVDADILLLGVFYVVVIAAFLFFNKVALNYRPVLIDGALEPSYPSSTTLLALSVMLSSVVQFNMRIGNKPLRYAADFIAIAFAVFMVATRVISGVHWLTDIIGSVLLSAALLCWYVYAIRK